MISSFCSGYLSITPSWVPFSFPYPLHICFSSIPVLPNNNLLPFGDPPYTHAFAYHLYHADHPTFFIFRYKYPAAFKTFGFLTDTSKSKCPALCFSTLTLLISSLSLFTKSCQFCLKISLEVSIYIYIMSSATLIILFGSYSSLLPELCLWSPYSLHVFLYTYTATCRLIFLDLKSDFVIVLLIIL